MNVKQLFPDAAVGAMVGFVAGILVGISIAHSGFLPNPHGLDCIIGGAVGAIAGGWIGKQGGAVAHWSLLMAAVIGGLSFAAGFVGPMIFWPDNNMGPLLGIFFTGPLGTIAGAALGALAGLIIRYHRGTGTAEEHPLSP